MKNLLIYSILLGYISCNKPIPSFQNQSSEKYNTELTKEKGLDTSQIFDENIPVTYQEKTKSIKRKQLITAKDDKSLLQDLVITKKLYKEEEYYILDYVYPYLNENRDAGYVVFNTYINNTYLNIEATESEILEDKVIFCDSLQIARCIDKRIMDYKIYNAKNNLISVLLYKENYYSGMKQSTYMFECLNFEMEKRSFLYYNDFFDEGSEKELLTLLNTQITQAIRSGEMYYECWEISELDFRAYKNNFVINDDHITYYFDDCIVCPSYTGTYSVEIPLPKLRHILKNYTDISDFW